MRYLLMLTVLVSGCGDVGHTTCALHGGTPLDVIVFAGQSNIVPTITAPNLPPDVAHPLTGVPYWYEIDDINPPGGKLIDMDLVVKPTGPNRAGLSLVAMDCLVDTGSYSLGAIEVDKVGTALSGAWDPADPASPGAMWTTLLGEVDFALDQMELPENDYAPTVRALVWVQGNGDKNQSHPAEDYDMRLLFLFERLRTELGARVSSDFALVYNRLHIDTTGTYVADVRASQQHLSDEFSWAHMVDIDDLDLQADLTHLTRDSRITLGQRVCAVLDGVL